MRERRWEFTELPTARLLDIFFLVTVSAFHRCGFSPRILGLVTRDAQTSGARGVVERGWEPGLHGWRWRFGVAISTSFLRRLERLFGFGGVVADFAFAGDPSVGGMGKCDAAHRVTFQLYRRRWRLLTEGDWAYQHQTRELEPPKPRVAVHRWSPGLARSET